jgi:quinohemoprotein ethanol dehydrogenase
MARPILNASGVVGLALGLSVAVGATFSNGGGADEVGPQTHETTQSDWGSYGLDAAETPYGPLTQIDATSVGRLGLAWSYDVPYHSPTLAPGTPLVVNGVLYTATMGSVTLALDARTGEEIWRFQPNPAAKLPPGTRGTPCLGSGGPSRGPMFDNRHFCCPDPPP